MFVPGKHFQPRLVFAGKARVMHLSGAPLKGRLLLQKSVNYSYIKFFVQAPVVQSFNQYVNDVYNFNIAELLGINGSIR